jgi:hypothetical protein
MTKQRRKVNRAVNRTTLSARARAWERAHRQGLKHDAAECNDKYVWLRLIAASSLQSTTKLVAHSLALHGRVNGRSIYPSTRVIAKESSLSERAVCTHLDKLVRSGRLWRRQLEIGRQWALTIYTLCAPKRELIQADETPPPWQNDPSWTPAPDVRGAEPHSAPDKAQGTERCSARLPSNGAEPDARGAERHADGTEPDADGTERHAGEVLNDVLSSLSSGVSHLSSSVSPTEEFAHTRTTMKDRRLKKDEDHHPKVSGRDKIEKLMRMDPDLPDADIARICGEPLELVVETRAQELRHA